MAFVLTDRTRETSVTTGTGDFTLGGAVDGFQSFSDVCSTDDTLWYFIVHSANNWEGGLGTYSATDTLTRTTVLESSNSGSLVDFGAGTKDVFIGFPSSKMLDLFDVAGLADQVRFNTTQSLTTTQKNKAKSNLGFTDNPTGGFSAGDAKLTYKTTADTGWVMMDDGTFGDASSGASTRANADTADAYAAIWAIGSAASIPILTSAGVASTYGATAAADFAAHKQLTLPRTLGMALAGAGSGSGLTARTIGTHVGSEDVTLTEAQMPSHTHGVNDPKHAHTVSGLDTDADQGAGVNVGEGTSSVKSVNRTTSSIATGITLQSAGSGSAHNNVQPTTFLNVMLKL